MLLLLLFHAFRRRTSVFPNGWPALYKTGAADLQPSGQPTSKCLSPLASLLLLEVPGKPCWADSIWAALELCSAASTRARHPRMCGPASRPLRNAQRSCGYQGGKEVPCCRPAPTPCFMDDREHHTPARCGVALALVCLRLTLSDRSIPGRPRMPLCDVQECVFWTSATPYPLTSSHASQLPLGSATYTSRRATTPACSRKSTHMARAMHVDTALNRGRELRPQADLGRRGPAGVRAPTPLLAAVRCGRAEIAASASALGGTGGPLVRMAAAPLRLPVRALTTGGDTPFC